MHKNRYLGCENQTFSNSLSIFSSSVVGGARQIRSRHVSVDTRRTFSFVRKGPRRTHTS
ncbi:unnamed protein product, partial [Nesidiocoris tenuis]